MPRPDAYRRRTALVVLAALAAPAAVRGEGPAAPDLHVAPAGVKAPGTESPDALAQRVRALRTRRNVGVGLLAAGATGLVVSLVVAANSMHHMYEGPLWTSSGSGQQTRDTSGWTGTEVAFVGSAFVTVAGAIVLFTSRGLHDAEVASRTQHPDAAVDPTPPAPPRVEPIAPYDPTPPFR
jgi:hypothetical protein